MFGWREVFVGTDAESFERVKRRLSENQIVYRIRIRDDGLRLSMNNLGGRQGAALSRGMGPRNVFYSVYVRKENGEYAREAIRGGCGTA